MMFWHSFSDLQLHGHSRWLRTELKSQVSGCLDWRCARVTGRTDLVHLPSRYHGPAERGAELTGPTGSVRAALLCDMADRPRAVTGRTDLVQGPLCCVTWRTDLVQ